MREIAPLVTVITPTYNHERYIEACIDSVLAQTEDRWEQIVVDDGSTDGTQDAVLAYTDPRIRYLRLDHVGITGLGSAYNRALDAARGTFVAILEGDDMWPADKLASQLPSFDNPGVVMSWGRAGVVDESGAVVDYIPDSRVLARAHRQGSGGAFASLLRGNYIPACSVMCRRSALVELGGFQQPPGLPNVDLPTWLELCRIGACVPAPGILGYWRRHAGQTTSVLADNMLRNIEWIETYFESLPASERAAIDLQPEEFRRIRTQSAAATRFLQGRDALRDGHAARARELFREAFRYGSTGTRARAVLGLGCARSGVNLESVLERSARLRLIATQRSQRLRDREPTTNDA